MVASYVGEDLNEIVYYPKAQGVLLLQSMGDDVLSSDVIEIYFLL
jgi:hypothetical protein